MNGLIPSQTGSTLAFLVSHQSKRFSHDLSNSLVLWIISTFVGGGVSRGLQNRKTQAQIGAQEEETFRMMRTRPVMPSTIQPYDELSVQQAELC